MTWYNSLAMICPAAQQDACNRLMLAIGRGPNTFSRRIRDKVTLALVAFGAHTYDDELADCLNTKPFLPALPLPISRLKASQLLLRRETNCSFHQVCSNH
jgi:hypothetical protein